KLDYISTHLPFMIWHFKTRTQIDIFEMRKMPSHVQHNAQTLHINVNIFNLATRVHMQPFHYNTCRFHNSLHMPQLVNGYTKLTIYMPSRNIVITTCVDMWIDTNKYWIGSTMTVAKLLQNGQIVNIDMDSQILSCFNFVNAHTIGCEKYIMSGKASLKSEIYFIDTYTVQAGAETPDILEYIDIGQSLTSVKKSSAGREGRAQLLVLLCDNFGIVNIQWRSIFLT